MELKRWGLVMVQDDNSFGPRATQYAFGKEESGSNLHEGDSVIIYQNIHYKLPRYGEPYTIVGYDEPGWVSVQITWAKIV